MTAPYSLLAAALLAAGVLVWPRRRGPMAVSRLRSLARAGLAPQRGPVGEARPLALRRVLGRSLRGGAALPVDLVMDLVACGLRAGLSLDDALAAGVGAQARAGPDIGRGEPGRRGAVRGGESPASTGLAAVVAQLEIGVAPDVAWRSAPAELQPLARAMLLAHLSGASAADVVARAAADVREARRQGAELAAARLGVRLVLPLGFAVLPGFVLLSVVPIVLGLATSVLGARP